MSFVEESRAIDLVSEARRVKSELRERMEQRELKSKERPRSTSKTRKSIETRQRIMDVTAQIMMERGNTAFQMGEVSYRCGMSKGALYYYFADKEDLVTAVFDASVNELTCDIDRIVADAQSPRQALLGISNAFALRVSEGSPLAMALVRDLLQWREKTTRGDYSRIDHIVNVIAELLDSAKEEGTVRRNINSHLAAVAACGAFTFGAFNALQEGQEGDGFTDEVLDYVIRGFEIR